MPILVITSCEGWSSTTIKDTLKVYLREIHIFQVEKVLIICSKDSINVQIKIFYQNIVKKIILSSWNLLYILSVNKAKSILGIVLVIK